MNQVALRVKQDNIMWWHQFKKNWENGNQTIFWLANSYKDKAILRRIAQIPKEKGKGRGWDDISSIGSNKISLIVPEIQTTVHYNDEMRNCYIVGIGYATIADLFQMTQNVKNIGNIPTSNVKHADVIQMPSITRTQLGIGSGILSLERFREYLEKVFGTQKRYEKSTEIPFLLLEPEPNQNQHYIEHKGQQAIYMEN